LGFHGNTAYQFGSCLNIDSAGAPC
jgi:hypothetical protein